MKNLGRFFVPALVPLMVLPVTAQDEILFVCENRGFGLSVVDVLQATGEHNTFLNLFSQYNPECFAILSDPELSDKTVWDPTGSAFLEVSDSLSSLSDEKIKAILGYHITPPRRTPEGFYPIVTPQFLAEGVEIIHQTRTGILTGSDQRVRTKVYDGVYTVEESLIMPIAWYTQTGSIFSISKVIMSILPLSWLERTFYGIIHTFFNYLYVYLSVLGIGIVVAILYTAKRLFCFDYTDRSNIKSAKLTISSAPSSSGAAAAARTFWPPSPADWPMSAASCSSTSAAM